MIKSHLRGSLQNDSEFCCTCHFHGGPSRGPTPLQHMHYLSQFLLQSVKICLHWMFLNFNVWNHYLKLDNQPFSKSFSLPRVAVELMTNSGIFKLCFYKVPRVLLLEPQFRCLLCSVCVKPGMAALVYSSWLQPRWQRSPQM